MLDFHCRECKGTGLVPCQCDCPHCDNETDCIECEGTGFCPFTVDLDAWLKAEAAFREKVSPVFRYYEKGSLIGIRSCIVYKNGVLQEPKHVLLIEDFLLKDKNTSKQQ